MPVTYLKTVAVLEGHCSVEEAEGLLEWLQDNPRGRVNLRDLSHPHSAVLQVLMALQPGVSVPPADPALADWLLPALGARPSAD